MATTKEGMVPLSCGLVIGQNDQTTESLMSSHKHQTFASSGNLTSCEG